MTQTGRPRETETQGRPGGRPTARERLDDLRAEVKRLERQIASAPCAEVGHDWRSLGGCNAGCGEGCGCSVPVNECRRCGDCDYGENEEAAEVRKLCQEALL